MFYSRSPLQSLQMPSIPHYSQLLRIALITAAHGNLLIIGLCALFTVFVHLGIPALAEFWALSNCLVFVEWSSSFFSPNEILIQHIPTDQHLIALKSLESPASLRELWDSLYLVLDNQTKQWSSALMPEGLCFSCFPYPLITDGSVRSMTKHSPFSDSCSWKDDLSFEILSKVLKL